MIWSINHTNRLIIIDLHIPWVKQMIWFTSSSHCDTTLYPFKIIRNTWKVWFC
jgi:hypothetical protein